MKNNFCNYCKKRGHWVRDCRKWIADGKPSGEDGAVKAMSHKCLPVMCQEINAVEDADAADWWIDNGATGHVTDNLANFKDFETFANPNFIKAAGTEVLEAIGKGTVELKSNCKNETVILDLTDVWYVPNI